MTNDTVRSALTAHSRGWTPVPLRPTHKAPIRSDWPQITYEAAEAVSSAFTDFTDLGDRARYYDGQPLNVGLALGSAHGGLVDIDIDHHKALAIASSLLPETPMRTGRAGRPGSHFWYVVEGYDPGIKGHKLPDGSMVIEYRAGGGQTVIPPSLHPDGDTYEWAGEEWGGADGPRRLSASEGVHLHATVLIIALLVTLADAWPKKGGRHAAYLPLVGGLLRDADEHGDPRLHPFWNDQIGGIIHLLVALTNDSDGPNTRFNESVETTRKKIVAGRKMQGWPTLAQVIGEDHTNKAREYVEQVEALLGCERGRVRRSGADDDEPAWVPRVVEDNEKQPETPEQRDVRVALVPDDERDPLEERLSEWEPVDLGPYVRGGWLPPEPGLLHRSDGPGLIYPGRVNLMYGEGGSGKTLIALDVAVKVMNEGGKVLVIDMEDEPVNSIDRFRSLGLADEHLLDGSLTYLRPLGDPLGVMHVDRWGQQVGSRERRSDAILRETLERVDPEFILVDGTTTLYRIHGLDTNGVQGTDLVGGWLRGLTDNNRRTVLLIDHTSKNAGPESGPIGSQHKIAMVQGIALRVKASKRPRRGGVGEAVLLVGKDRLGQVMGVSSDADTPVAAEVVFDGTGPNGSLSITYDPPQPGSTSSVQFVDPRVGEMLRVLRAKAGILGEHDRAWMSPREIRLAAGVDFDAVREKNVQRDLLRDLVDEGEIEHNGVTTSASKYRAVLPPDID